MIKTKTHIKTKVSFKYFANDCLWKFYFAFIFPPDPSKRNFVDSSGASKAFHTVLI